MQVTLSRKALGSGTGLDRETLRKRLTSSSPPVYFNIDEADAFIDYVVDESLLFKTANVVRMNGNTKNVRELLMDDPILRTAVCGTCADTVDIADTNKQLISLEMEAVLHICDNFLEDNLEGPSIAAHLTRMAGDKIRNELEIWSIMANTGGYYTTTMANAAIMAARDGWYDQARTSGHVLDAITATDGRCITRCKLKQMVQTLPTKYRVNQNRLRFYMASNTYQDYVDTLAARGTVLGDAAVQDRLALSYDGIKIVPVPLIPTDISACSGGSVSPANGTFVMLTPIDNLVVGMQRSITYERQREGCAKETIHIWTLRADVMVLNDDSMVLYDCIQTPCDCV